MIVAVVVVIVVPSETEIPNDVVTSQSDAGGVGLVQLPDVGSVG